MKKVIIFLTLILFFSHSYGQNAKKLVKSGMRKYYDKEFNSAIIDFSKAIELDSSSAEAYSWRGYTKNRLNDYLGAISDFSKSILLAPKDLDNYFMSGEIRHKIFDYKGAINDFTSGIKVYPSVYSLYLKRALVKYDSTDYIGAIKDFTSSIELNYYNKSDEYISKIDTSKIRNSTVLDYTESFYFRGLAKKNIKDFRGALTDFTRILEINLLVYSPDFKFESRVLYEATGYRLNKSTTAKFIEKSLPILSDALYQRGLVNFELKNYLQASEDFTNVINLKPNNPNAYFYRGLSNFMLKEYSSSRGNCNDDFTKAIKLNPDFTDAYFYRGLLINASYSKEGQNAYDDFSKAISLKPNFPEAYLNRGIHMFNFRARPYKESFSIDEIIDNYNKAINLKPFYADAYYHRGKAKSHFDKKDYQGAIYDYTKAIEQNKNFREAFEDRGHTFYRLQQFKEACSDIRKAIEMGGTYLHDILKIYCK